MRAFVFLQYFLHKCKKERKSKIKEIIIIKGNEPHGCVLINQYREFREMLVWGSELTSCLDKRFFQL